VSSVVSRIAVAHFDWRIIVPFTLAGVAGTLVGKRVADRLSGRALGIAFAWLLVAVGSFVGIQSILAL
ncbi:MAG TPA: sulfite exporter TauE/SafE family protein, partial [Actinomycetes bacterium]|nr:sulfite exporter TauE/SafE family protein [Actinomycetes bacterium]